MQADAQLRPASEAAGLIGLRDVHTHFGPFNNSMPMGVFLQIAGSHPFQMMAACGGRALGRAWWATPRRAAGAAVAVALATAACSGQSSGAGGLLCFLCRLCASCVNVP